MPESMEPGSMKVVVATDGSEAAIEAARRSMTLLRPNATVTLVMVIPEYEDPMEDAGGIEGSSITYKQADKDWQRSTTAGQSALARTAAALGPDVDVRLVPDDEATGAAVVRVAQELAADVLVIGSSGKNWLSRLIGGSVSDYVAHHAPCPVMLIRHDH
ncbi:MAG TPA: universal stress protein [Acidimicrobiales bacterium]|nr:universal stress protein [Acidimicrobiales bacterium]